MNSLILEFISFFPNTLESLDKNPPIGLELSHVIALTCNMLQLKASEDLFRKFIIFLLLNVINLLMESF